MLKDFEDFKSIWNEECIVIMDTNSIIDLYFYSTESCNNILDNLKSIFEQIWLPNQVIVEFARNHKDTREAAFKKYHNLEAEIKKILRETGKSYSKLFSNYSRYNFPQISRFKADLDKEMNEIAITLDKYKNDISVEVNKNKEILQQDLVKGFIDDLITKKQVGHKYIVTQLMDLYKEGEIRYKYCIPPGYSDIGKDKNDKTKTRKFGDLIIWKQIIDKAKADQKTIIFVSNDNKEDWWDKKNNCPRCELKEEFNSFTETENLFYMLTLKDFIQNISVINNKYSVNTMIELEMVKIVGDLILDGNNISSGSFMGDIVDKVNDNLHYDIYKTIENEKELEIDEFSDFIFLSTKLNNCNVDIDNDVDKAIFYGSISTEIKVDVNKYYSQRNHKIGNIILCVEIDFTLFTQITYLEKQYEIDIDEIDIDSVELLSFEDNINYDEICVICKNKIGTYFYDDGGLVCDDCLGDTEEVEVCTGCGNVFPAGGLIDGERCENCY